MKNIISQVKMIKADISDMAEVGLNRSALSLVRGQQVRGEDVNAPSNDKKYVVDDVQTGTVARKAAVHLGLLAEDGMELASRLNPARRLRASLHSSGEQSSAGSKTPGDEHHNVRYRQKIDILAEDGTALCANLFAPMTEDPEQTLPVIIFVNSWLMDKHQYLLQARRFARKGYIVLSYSARGWGKSGGIVDVGGPADMGDLSTVIDWLVENTPVDRDNIGCAGISYGSGMSLLGAAHDERIKTVVCMSGWTDLMEAFWSQQTPRRVCAKLLVTSSDLAAKTDDRLGFLLNSLLCNQNMDQVRTWARERSPVTYMERYNRRKPPIYIIQNFQDELFQPNAVLDFYAGLEGPKRIDINLGTHATAEITGILGMKNHLWKQTHDWFNYWLKGEPNQVMEQSPVSCQFERHSKVRLNIGKYEGSRFYLEDWPSNRLETRSFHLSSAEDPQDAGRLLTKHVEQFEYDNAFNSIRSGPGASKPTAGLPFISSMKNAHLNMPLKLNLDKINRELAVVFESDPLPRSEIILGTPQLSLQIASSRPQVQLIAYLYEGNAGGRGRLITHGPVTRHCVEPGKPFELSFELITTCYEVVKGSRLILIIDTSDLQYQAPTRDDFEVTFHHASANQPRLIIPFAPSPNSISDIRV